MAPRRSWDKADNPYWRTHVGSWFRSSLEAEEYCRRHKLSTVTFERWARHLLTPKDLRKRAEYLRELYAEKQKKRARNAPRRKQNAPPRRRYGARTDRGPLALHAFWGMHVEAMNWSGMGLAEYAAALDLSPHALRRWRDRFEESGTEMDWRSLLHPSTRAQLSSAANCVRRKYRLTPGAADGRSNRRTFTNEQKRAIVAETERLASPWRRSVAATALPPAWPSAGAKSSA